MPKLSSQGFNTKELFGQRMDNAGDPPRTLGPVAVLRKQLTEVKSMIQNQSLETPFAMHLKLANGQRVDDFCYQLAKSFHGKRSRKKVPLMNDNFDG
jgi:hypothetical protein